MQYIIYALSSISVMMPQNYVVNPLRVHNLLQNNQNKNCSVVSSTTSVYVRITEL